MLLARMDATPAKHMRLPNIASSSSNSLPHVPSPPVGRSCHMAATSATQGQALAGCARCAGSFYRFWCIGSTMAAGPPPRNVRDVPAEEFIKAYAEHLKANDKVGISLRHS